MGGLGQHLEPFGGHLAHLGGNLGAKGAAESQNVDFSIAKGVRRLSFGIGRAILKLLVAILEV